MIGFLQEVSRELEEEFEFERELLQRSPEEVQNVEKQFEEYFLRKILGEDRMVIC